MPGGDGTGPMGFGPMTGRRMGYCAGYSVPGFMNVGFGRGMGRGFGRGRGFGMGRRQMLWMQNQGVMPQPIQPTKQEEVQMLQQELEGISEEEKALKQEREEIKKIIEELKKQK